MKMRKGAETAPLHTVEEASELLACSVKTTRRLIEAGALPVVRIGRLVRVHPEDLRRFINAHRS